MQRYIAGIVGSAERVDKILVTLTIKIMFKVTACSTLKFQILTKVGFPGIISGASNGFWPNFVSW